MLIFLHNRIINTWRLLCCLNKSKNERHANVINHSLVKQLWARMGSERSENLILREEDSGRQDVSFKCGQNISCVYSGVHFENSVIILKILLELIKISHHFMDVDLWYFSNFTPHVGVSDTVITLPLSMQKNQWIFNRKYDDESNVMVMN